MGGRGVEALGGRIDITSSERQGTALAAEIPCAAVSEFRAVQRASA
jgi:signal transduction histidine kinase